MQELRLIRFEQWTSDVGWQRVTTSTHRIANVTQRFKASSSHLRIGSGAVCTVKDMKIPITCIVNV